MNLPDGYWVEPQLFDVRFYDDAGALIVIADQDDDRARRAVWFQWHRKFGAFDRPLLDIRDDGMEDLDDGAKAYLDFSG